MENALTQLMSMSFILFALGIAGLTFLFKRLLDLIDLKYPKVFGEKKSAFQDIILSIVPVLLGLFLGLLVKAYPYPSEFTSPTSRAFFGILAGMASTGVVRIAKAMLNAKLSDKDKIE